MFKLDPAGGDTPDVQLSATASAGEGETADIAPFDETVRVAEVLVLDNPSLSHDDRDCATTTESGDAIELAPLAFALEIHCDEGTASLDVGTMPLEALEGVTLETPSDDNAVVGDEDEGEDKGKLGDITELAGVLEGVPLLLIQLLLCADAPEEGVAMDGVTTSEPMTGSLQTLFSEAALEVGLAALSVLSIQVLLSVVELGLVGGVAIDVVVVVLDQTLLCAVVLEVVVVLETGAETGVSLDMMGVLEGVESLEATLLPVTEAPVI